MAKKIARLANRASFGTTWNAGSTAQACGFRGTQSDAIVHAVPEFIGGMSASKAERSAPENLATAKEDDRGSPRISAGGVPYGANLPTTTKKRIAQ
jgi:hypothetical protein